MKEPIDKHLLLRYSRNECTPEELAKIRSFARQPEFEAELEKILDGHWVEFEVPPPDNNTTSEWKKSFHERIASANKHTNLKQLQRWRWIGYAAALLIVSLVTVYVSRKSFIKASDQLVFIEKYNPRGQRSIVKLPDSSVIYLGPESRLKFPQTFAANKREVFLQGEAFFQVKHHVNKPFIVVTGAIHTQVLGTTFKVEAYKGQSTAVAVASGKVSVTLISGHSQNLLALLMPGQLIRYNPHNGQAKKEFLAIEDINSWKNGQLVFNNARLDEIAIKLSRWYDTNIILTAKETKAYRLSFTVDGKAAVNPALDAICASAGLKYLVNKDQITISPL